MVLDEINMETIGLLNEGLSSRLFHFCPLSALYQIVEFDSFRLTSSDARPSDREMTSVPIGNGKRKYYPYYMCFSRTPSSLAGYVAMRRSKGSNKNWQQTLVRIEVDGDLLSRYYNGMPVNYFTDKKDKKIEHNYEFKYVIDPSTGERKKIRFNTVKGRYGTEYSKRMTVQSLNKRGNIVPKEIRRYTPHMDDSESPQGKPRNKVAVDYGVLDRNQMHEFEDRLFSYTEYIRNAHKYIKRIDIYIAPSVANGMVQYSEDALHMLRQIMSTAYGKFTHVYTNQADFETMGKTNKVGEFDWRKIGSTDKNTIALSRGEIRAIVRYATIVSFSGNQYPDWKDRTKASALSLIRNMGLYENGYDEQINYFIDKYLDDIEHCGKRFFMIQSNTLKKELEDIPPYKYRKYISPIDAIAKAQREQWREERGKDISILAVKQNMVA